MEPEHILVIRKRLADRLEVLTRKAGLALGALTDVRDTMSDQTDMATEESDRDLALRMHDRDRKVVAQIQTALKSIDRGDYGECVHCGDDISERRLLARPMATHCIDCMTEFETRRLVL